jgi:hypothetical protein
LIGNQAVIDALLRGDDPRLISQMAQDGLQGFLTRREGYLLY